MADDLFYALLAGIILGAFYDWLRLFRLVFNRHLFLDLFFWCTSAFAVFSYLLIFNNGSIRVIYLLFIFAGFSVYIFTLGYVTEKIELKLSQKIKFWFKKIKNRLKSFKKVLQSVNSLYYNIKAKLFKFHKNVADTVGDDDE